MRFMPTSLLLGTLFASAAVASNGTMTGSGTAGSPWMVADYADLKMVGAGGSTGYNLGDTYRLAGDINADASHTENAGLGFIPIGYSNSAGTILLPFTGIFHGAGHVIKNLYIYRQNQSNVGLFNANSGTIDSLGLVNSNRHVYNNDYAIGPRTILGYMNVGALVGNNTGTVKACYSTVGVWSGFDNGGGLVGLNTGVVTNSYTTAGVWGTYQCGGVLGRNDPSGSVSTVWGASKVSCSNANIGGIAGYTGGGTYASNVWDTLAWVLTANAIKQTAGATVGSLVKTGGLNTTQMQAQTNFAGFDFANVWKIREGKGYPGLRGVYNAPFAVADSFAVRGGDFDLKKLLLNDASVESATANLTLRILTLDNGTTDSVNVFRFPTNIGYGAIAKLTYMVGEVRANDTLWGNVVPAKILRLGMAGSGTDADPYLVADYIDLRRMSVDANTTSMTKVYRVTADIDASTSASTAAMNPIGWGIAEFSGKFHGGGHRIKNFSVSINNTGVGLFSFINTTGYIDSVVMVNPNVWGGNNTGALAGLNRGTILYPTVLGGKVGLYGNALIVGGVVGENKGTILGAYAKDSVMATSGNSDAGGIVGYLNTGGVLSNSRFDGYIAGVYRVGGVVGFMEIGTPKVIRCINTGTVTGSASSVGGVVGQNGAAAGSGNGGIIDSSYNTGKVLGGTETTGGILGFGSSGGKIRYCYNTGSVSAPQYVGGIVGGWVGTTTSAGAVDSIVNCYNTGRVTSNDIAGGIVGHGNYNGGALFMAMDKCYNTGWVRGAAGRTGGLLGISNNTSSNIVVTNSYWDRQTSQQLTSEVVGAYAGLTTANMFKAENYTGWDFTNLWKFRSDSTTYPGFQFEDNAPVAFADTFDLPSDSVYLRLSTLLKNDRSMQTGNLNLVVKVDSISSGTISADSSSWVRFSDVAKNRDSILVSYRVGEVRSTDTLWGNLTRSNVYFVSPWRNTYYALYTGSALNAGVAGTATISNLIASKTPSISAVAGMDNTKGLLWADSSEELMSAKGLNYYDDFAYVSGKAISHVVANIKATQYSGDSVTTLLTEGFYPTSGTGYYPWIRVSTVGDSLHLDLVAFSIANGVTTSVSYAATKTVVAPASAIFNGQWLPVHLMVQNINGKFRVSVYLGSSIKASSAFAISMDYPTAYLNPVGAYSKRTVEIPQPGTVSRTPTFVDQKLGGQTVVKTGYGAALVGDFAMISSATMTREDLVHGYLSPWKHAGAGTTDSASYVMETTQPLIKQILYSAPGDQSTVSYTKTTGSTSTVNFSYGTNLDFDVFAGVQIEPEVLTGEVGADVKVGMHMNMTNENSNTYTTETESSAGYSTSYTAGDMVIAQSLLTAHHLFLRPRTRYLFASNDINESHYVHYVATVPEASREAETVQSVTSFLETFKGNQPVLRNFWNLYAKDSLGNVRADLIASGLLVQRSGTEGELVFNGLASKTMTASVAASKEVAQSYSVTAGFFVNVDVTCGGARAGFDLSFDATRGEQKSTDVTNTFQTDVTFLDDDSWDQHDLKIYDDLRWGVPVFVLQHDNSFTSGPQEVGSQSVTNIESTLTETTDSIHAGDTVQATILVTNNSSNLITSSIIDQVQVKMEATPNFLGVYTLLAMDPATFQLARGKSQSVKVKYIAKNETTTPISFWINDGFIENQNYNYLENNEVDGVKTVGPALSSSSSVDPSSSSSDVDAVKAIPSSNLWHLSVRNGQLHVQAVQASVFTLLNVQGQVMAASGSATKDWSANLGSQSAAVLRVRVGSQAHDFLVNPRMGSWNEY